MVAAECLIEWFLLKTQKGTAGELVRRLRRTGFEAFSPRFDGAVGQAGEDYLLPFHVFVRVADPEVDDGALHRCIPAVDFVTNEGNRPLVIPGHIAEALRDPSDEGGQYLRGLLSSMAPEYRLERLQMEFSHPAGRTALS